MAPFQSKVIDPTKAHGTDSGRGVPSALTSPYFISLPVRTCERSTGDVITNAIRQTIESCSTFGSKARMAALQRHTNPFGNLYGMMFSMSEQDRLGIAVKFIEFLCILDDIMEELPYEQSIREHDILCQALRSSDDLDPSVVALSDDKGVPTSESLDGMTKFLINIRKSVLALGVEQGSILLADLERSLQERECAPATFTTLEEYLPYRVMNLDWCFVCILLRWSMDLPLDLSSSQALANFEYLGGVIAGLCNDYYSWNREKAHYSDSESSDRIMNGIPVLMREYSLPEVRAKELLKDTIIEGADQLVQFRMRLEEIEENDSRKGLLERYTEALESLAGGYVYWCSTCPRYHVF